MKNSNNGFLNFLSFVALIIMAVLTFISKLLPIVEIDITGSTINLLSTVRDALVLLVVSLGAWKFASTKGKKTKTIFVISLLIFVAGIVLIWFVK